MNVAVTDLTSDAVRPYLDWLAQQRRNEEVLADLRICRAIHDTTRDVPLVRQYNVRGAGAQVTCVSLCPCAFAFSLILSCSVDCCIV